MIDKEKYTEGLHGEGVIRDYLKRNKIHFMQADLLFKHKGSWFSAEIKNQERFEPPPFEGHGLPMWQVEARLRLQNDTGIRAMFFVVEKPTDKVFWNYMDLLNKGEKIQTNGAKPRVIFPLSNFNTLNV